MTRKYSRHAVASGVFFRHVGALYRMQIIAPMIYTMDLVDRSKNTSDTRLLRVYTASDSAWAARFCESRCFFE
jgi:hypothetical protein